MSQCRGLWGEGERRRDRGPNRIDELGRAEVGTELTGWLVLADVRWVHESHEQRNKMEISSLTRGLAVPCGDDHKYKGPFKTGRSAKQRVRRRRYRGCRRTGGEKQTKVVAALLLTCQCVEKRPNEKKLVPLAAEVTSMFRNYRHRRYIRQTTSS